MPSRVSKIHSRNSLCSHFPHFVLSGLQPICSANISIQYKSLITPHIISFDGSGRISCHNYLGRTKAQKDHQHSGTFLLHVLQQCYHPENTFLSTIHNLFQGNHTTTLWVQGQPRHRNGTWNFVVAWKSRASDTAAALGLYHHTGTSITIDCWTAAAAG